MENSGTAEKKRYGKSRDVPCGNGTNEEKDGMHHSVVLARIAHVEEDNGADERCKETNQQEVAHRVRKIIWEGDCRRLQQDKIQPTTPKCEHAQ